MKPVSKKDAKRVNELLQGDADKLTPSDCGGLLVNFLPSFAWDGKTLIRSGQLFQFDDNAFIALVDTYDQPTYKPGAGTIDTLFQAVEFREYNGEKIRVIPARFVGTVNAFKLNELAYYKADGHVYKCLIDTCVYTPDVAPTLWQLVD